jgi:hypothetical protein
MGGLIKFFTSLLSGIVGFVGGLVGGKKGGKKGGYYMDAGPATVEVAPLAAAAAPKAAPAKTAAPAATQKDAKKDAKTEKATAKSGRAAKLEALKDAKAAPGKTAQATNGAAAAPMDVADLIAAAVTVNTPKVALPIEFATKFVVPTIVPRRRPGANMTGYLDMAKEIGKPNKSRI